MLVRVRQTLAGVKNVVHVIRLRREHRLCGRCDGPGQQEYLVDPRVQAVRPVQRPRPRRKDTYYSAASVTTSKLRHGGVLNLNVNLTQ